MQGRARRPEVNEALRGHSAYWRRQTAQGNVVLTGAMGGDYWDNVALIILNVAAREEAEAL